MEEIYNWGMYPKVNAEVRSFGRVEELAEQIKKEDTLIARGNGRCYGDSALQRTIFSTLSLNKIISLDVANGIIRCESGVLLDDILKVIVPKGFFLPVTPGTKFVSLGGAVAANIHGKNHHKEGALSAYIQSFRILNENGELLDCSANANAELFRNTIGGMGLTGMITDVTIRLKKIETSYINQKSIKAKNLDELLSLFEQHPDYTYSVAWLDCLSGGNSLGRSILMLGEHTRMEELNEPKRKEPLKVHSSKQFNVPFNFPAFTLNNLSITAFNTLVYYLKQLGNESNSIIHYDPYFYPLDVMNHWNRIYGKNGFTQYQFVLPFENGKAGLKKIMTKMASSGNSSFFGVLKTFGEADALSSSLSFPRPGYTLAADFKVTKNVLKLLDELDKLVMEYGGRLYLAKDARMTKETFHKTYGDNFTHSHKFNSLQSDRLDI